MTRSETHTGEDAAGVGLPWSRMRPTADTAQQRPHPPQARGTAPLLPSLLLLLFSALLAPAAGGQNGELCVVETPLKTQYVRPVVESHAECPGCMFPHSLTATAITPPSDDAHTPLVSQVHILHVDRPEGGAVEVLIGQQGSGALSKVVLVLHSSRGDAPVRFTITATTNTNATHTFLVSGEDEVRGSNLQYSVAHQPRLPEENLIPSVERKFGFVTSYTHVPQANTIFLQLPHDVESGEGCNTEVKDNSPVADCFISQEQPISGCYHHNMLGENDRDIHIIEVDGSSNSNGSLVLAVVGNSEGSNGDSSTGNGKKVERNITLVLSTSRPTTWSLHTTSLQGTITLLVGGGDQVENTSVSGPGVMVEVQTVDVPATFDQLVLTVLTSVGPPVSYTRTTSPNKITITVPQKIDNRVVVPSYLPDSEQPTVYAEDVAAVIQGALSVRCDDNAMTVAIPYYVSERVGGISISLADRSCTGFMNVSHIVIKEKFGRCRFTRQSSSYQTTYTNYVNVELGPGISDDEDFDGSGYGSQDEYYAARIPPIPVQCQVQPHVAVPATQSTYKKTTSESVAGATYKMDMFQDRDHRIPIGSDDFPTSTSVDQRLYIRAALASVMPWTEAYDADLRVVLEECWLSNSSIPSHTGAPHELLVKKSCPFHPSVVLEPLRYHSQTSSFSFQVLSDYDYLVSFYLHCQLGICSADSLPRPAVKRCKDPGRYCSKPALVRIDPQPSSSSLQTLTLGPFSVASSTRSALSGSSMKTSSGTSNIHGSSSAGSSSAASSSTDDKTQIIVLGGLSTEIVVGIALASFVIGVCLTATLWVIHMKTDPRQQKRPEGSGPRNSGYDLSAHSGSSTPSSQAPMTA